MFQNGKGTFDGMESFSLSGEAERHQEAMDASHFDDDDSGRDRQGEQMLERARQAEVNNTDLEMPSGEGRNYKTIDGQEYMLWGFNESITDSENPSRNVDASYQNAYKLDQFNAALRDGMKDRWNGDAEEFHESVVFYEKQLEVIQQEMVDKGIDLNTAHPDLRKSLDQFEAQKNYISVLKEHPDLAEGVIENLKTTEEIQAEEKAQKVQEERETFRMLMKEAQDKYEASPEFQNMIRERDAFLSKLEEMDVDIALREYDASLKQEEIDSFNIEDYPENMRKVSELHLNTLKHERDEQRIKAEHLRSARLSVEAEYLLFDPSIEDGETRRIEAFDMEKERIKQKIDVMQMQAEFAMEMTPLKVEMSIDELQEEVGYLEEVLEGIQLETVLHNERVRSASSEEQKKNYEQQTPIIDFYRNKIATRLRSRERELASKERITAAESEGAVIIDPDFDAKILSEVERRIDIEEIKTHLNEKEKQLPADSGIEMSMKRQMRDLQRDLDAQTQEFQQYLVDMQQHQQEIFQREARLLELGEPAQEDAEASKGFFARMSEIFGVGNAAEARQLREEIADFKSKREAAILMMDDAASKMAFTKGAIKFVEMKTPSADEEKKRADYLKAQEISDSFKNNQQQAA